MNIFSLSRLSNNIIEISGAFLGVILILVGCVVKEK